MPDLKERAFPAACHEKVEGVPLCRKRLEDVDYGSGGDVDIPSLVVLTILRMFFIVFTPMRVRLILDDLYQKRPIFRTRKPLLQQTRLLLHMLVVQAYLDRIPESRRPERDVTAQMWAYE
ncbi:hypothetical protein NLJ89_g9863 [Agrocybe chaxingu]|uniref:Uncharacterized protein n=1 Tax=Agrocybe chaxingu TaxID=84603 RepID=A0A9W8MSN7_9AGAR|nr:hypothetical protein NLJ89_g9863 [Agrocybe chaxingu]